MLVCIFAANSVANITLGLQKRDVLQYKKELD